MIDSENERRNVLDWDLDRSHNFTLHRRLTHAPRFGLDRTRRTLSGDLPLYDIRNNRHNHPLRDETREDAREDYHEDAQENDREDAQSNGHGSSHEVTKKNAVKDNLNERIEVLDRRLAESMHSSSQKRADPPPPPEGQDLSTFAGPQHFKQLPPLMTSEKRRRYIDLELALDVIKTFDGNDPNKLYEFILSCEKVWPLVEPEQQNNLLALVRTSKLKDRALRDMMYKTINNIEEFKAELQTLYGKSFAMIQFEFSSLRQGAKESLSAYARRTKILTFDLIEKLCENVDPRDARTIEEAMRKCAQANFENGLRKNVRNIIRSRNYKFT